MSDLVRPLTEASTRMPEHGRIRLGVQKRAQSGKMRPASIDTFRFTSADEEAIRQIAALYGGEARPWNDAKANPPNQFEVITRSTAVRIFIASGGLSLWYELWSGGGCQRRCDGITCQLAQGDDMIDADCLCAKNNKMLCKPTTRLNVILPEIRFGGVWRLESHGWNAAKELPAMEAILTQLQGAGIVEGLLCLEKAQSQGGRKQYVVPRLKLSASPDAILAGEARLRSLAPAEVQAQLNPGTLDPGSIEFGRLEGADSVSSVTGTADSTSAVPGPSLDDEIVDAEIVEDRETSNLSPTSPGKDGEAVASSAADPPASPGPHALTGPETRTVIVCNQAAAKAGMDPDWLRHALVRKATQGHETSSRVLTDAQRVRVDEWATAIADGDSTVTVVKQDPPAVNIESV